MECGRVMHPEIIDVSCYLGCVVTDRHFLPINCYIAEANTCAKTHVHSRQQSRLYGGEIFWQKDGQRKCHARHNTSILNLLE